jgi:electron transport complex protein RnfC
VITSGFGYRWGRRHNGIDIGMPTGSSVLAADGGKVLFSGVKGSYGKLVIIDHGANMVSYYAHNSRLLVKKGDKVFKGQAVANPDGYVSAGMHAPTSGTVTEIAEHPLPHPSGLSGLCIVIEPDGEDTWWPDLPEAISNYLEANPADIRQRVREAGIVGLGGAAFPTSVKLNPPATQPVDTLIINAAECEPYITCDDRLMRERPGEIIEGIEIIQHALGIDRVMIGVEDNKPDAIRSLKHKIEELGTIQIEVITVPTIYPTGGEKQLIQILTGKEVPSHGLPSDIGVVCHNVGTAAAVYRAVAHGEPLISRIMTVTGSGVN